MTWSYLVLPVVLPGTTRGPTWYYPWSYLVLPVALPGPTRGPTGGQRKPRGWPCLPLWPYLALPFSKKREKTEDL